MNKQSIEYFFLQKRIKGTRWIIVVLYCPCCSCSHVYDLDITRIFLNKRIPLRCPETGKGFYAVLGPYERHGIRGKKMIDKIRKAG